MPGTTAGENLAWGFGSPIHCMKKGCMKVQRIQYIPILAIILHGMIAAMPINDGFSGLSNYYMFKNRLQEYAEKVGLAPPVYKTIQEGPSNEPSFQSTVTVNNVSYDSLPGFPHRKEAEQSAAEVALLELAKSGELNESVIQPAYKTGLCKNVLQHVAQKLKYPIPAYKTQMSRARGRILTFSSTVEVGGINYAGQSARTKKAAEVNAAEVALLAIKSDESEVFGEPVATPELTLLPCRKRAAEQMNSPGEIMTLAARRARHDELLTKLSGVGAGQVAHTSSSGDASVDSNSP